VIFNDPESSAEKVTSTVTYETPWAVVAFNKTLILFPASKGSVDSTFNILPATET